MWTGKCSLIKGVTKQPLLLLSSMLSREKQATPRFLRAAGLMVGRLFKLHFELTHGEHHFHAVLSTQEKLTTYRKARHTFGLFLIAYSIFLKWEI